MTQERQMGTMRTQPNEQIREAAGVIRTETFSGGTSKPEREREPERQRERDDLKPPGPLKGLEGPFKALPLKVLTMPLKAHKGPHKIFLKDPQRAL